VDHVDPRNLQRATTGATNTPATTVRSTQASTAPAPVYAPVRLGRDVCGPETWLLGRIWQESDVLSDTCWSTFDFSDALGRCCQTRHVDCPGGL